MNINRAIKEAKKSDHDKYKHATLLFRGSTLVAAGYNQGKKHSEIMALNKVKHKGSTVGLTLVNVRINKNGEIGLSKPCVNCQIALDKAGIGKKYWTVDSNINHCSRVIEIRINNERRYGSR